MSQVPGPVSSARRWVILSLAALLYVAVVAAVTPWLSLVIQRDTLVDGAVMPLGALIALFTLAGVNAWRARRGKRPFTSPGETLGFFAIVIIGTWPASWSFVEQTMPLLTAPYVFASPENGWMEYVLPNLPRWAIGPTQEPYATAFYGGLTGDTRIPWGMWLTPVLAWTAFAVVLTVFMIGLSSLLSRQWIDHDRLSFPHAEVQIGIARDFFSDRRFWYGVALTSAVPMWNLLQQFVPVLPKASLLFGSGDGGFEWFKGAEGIIPVLNVGLLGLLYFVHRDISLSLCVFFFAVAFERYGVSLSGIKFEHQDSLVADPVGWQTTGALLMLVVFSLWSGRRTIGEYIRRAMRGERDDRGWLSPRLTVTAVGAGFLGVAIWQIMLGMRSAGPLLGFLISMPLQLIGTGRITAESSMGVEVPVVPSQIALLTGGTAALLPIGCVALALTAGWMTTWTSQLSTSMQAERFRAGFRIPRLLLVTALLAVVIATVVSMYSTAHVCYTRGASSFGGNNWGYQYHMRMPFDQATEQARTPFHTCPKRLGWLALGIVIMWGLIFLRNHVVGWFLHPVGFILSAVGKKAGTNSNQYVFTVFIAWVVKTLVLKLGGAEAYERFKPFFGGLAAGYALPSFLSMLCNVGSFLVCGRPLGT